MMHKKANATQIVLAFFIFVYFFAYQSLGLSSILPKNSGDKVSVIYSSDLLDVTPKEAYESWLNFTWKGGGGLPIVTLANNDKSSRLLLPLFAKEKLLKENIDDSDAATGDDVICQKYVLTELGPIWKSEIVPDSHLGIVSFQKTPSGTRMTWDVNFLTLNRRDLWQSVTESSISDACENLKAYLSEPLLWTNAMTLSTNQTAQAICEQWLEFVWQKGGNLSPIPPISLSKDGSQDRLIAPPFLKERILHVKKSQDSCEILYTVVNPSILTFYPAYTHLGQVRFQSKDGGIQMIWEVSVRPIRGFEMFVKLFTEAVINTLTMNFNEHVQDNGIDSFVNVYPPRGLWKEKGPLLKFRKATWIGNVLDAHLRDDRSVMEQTRDLFRPWKWGYQRNSSPWGRGQIISSENSSGGE